MRRDNQNYLRIPLTNKWNEKFKLHKNATDNFHEYLYNLILRSSLNSLLKKVIFERLD